MPRILFLKNMLKEEENHLLLLQSQDTNNVAILRLIEDTKRTIEHMKNLLSSHRDGKL